MEGATHGQGIEQGGGWCVGEEDGSPSARLQGWHDYPGRMPCRRLPGDPALGAGLVPEPSTRPAELQVSPRQWLRWRRGGTSDLSPGLTRPRGRRGDWNHCPVQPGRVRQARCKPCGALSTPSGTGRTHVPCLQAIKASSGPRPGQSASGDVLCLGTSLPLRRVPAWRREGSCLAGHQGTLCSHHRGP